MTLTKPALRSSLGDEHFKQACWVAFNSPGFHEVDVMAFVKRWKADGHLSAVMKDQGAIRAREVLERKANEHNAKLAFYAEWKLKHHLLPPSTLVTATPTVPQAHTSAPLRLGLPL